MIKPKPVKRRPTKKTEPEESTLAGWVQVIVKDGVLPSPDAIRPADPPKTVRSSAARATHQAASKNPDMDAWAEVDAYHRAVQHGCYLLDTDPVTELSRCRDDFATIMAFSACTCSKRPADECVHCLVSRSLKRLNAVFARADEITDPSHNENNNEED